MTDKSDSFVKAPPNLGPGRVIKACGHALDGIKVAWRTEGAFRQELVAAALLVPVAWYLGVSAIEWVLLIGSLLPVMIVELLNCSIEAAIDRISLEHHPLSKAAKDTGSAAVLLSIVLCALVWVVILGPKVLQRLGGA